jgi:EAL domain-containing protein (putative c-di-GMP-specific phosphodiesterase class I)
VENSALLFDMTCWVIRQSQKFHQQLRQHKQQTVDICINLHATVFQQQNFRERIEQLLLNEIEHPQHFILEITEDMLVSDMSNLLTSLQLLHDKGYRIALDDFGTRQSSLSHLRMFPIDIIKVDREFICNILNNANDANLVKAIIGLGNDLHIEVVAEGVENEQQLDFLAKAGCHLFQGHYFSEPLPTDQYQAYTRQKNDISV